ncbi:MAG: hypothetical protein ACI934_001377 [Pseudohongiellaceae bacterium]|jgi:hypothetical protein
MKESVHRPGTSESEPASHRTGKKSGSADKTQQTSQLISQTQANSSSSAALLNGGQQSAAQRKMSNTIENSSMVRAQESVAQKLSTSGKPSARDSFSKSAQLAEDEDLLQGKNLGETAQRAESSSTKSNETGLPDNLKSGIESLSGMSMDSVNVHYNSDQPAQLNAHAFAQGTDIHVAPGQEQHLPHEAWHVVQQAQGRVKPTRQMKGDVNVNDDVGLETEADVMGAKALQQVSTESESLLASNTKQAKEKSSSNTAQRVIGDVSTNVESPQAIFENRQKKKIEAEAAQIQNASTFSGIAQVIDSSISPKKGEAAVKLRNTEKGIVRARKHFDNPPKVNGVKPPSMQDEKNKFIEERYDGALKDQKVGIAEKSPGGNKAMMEIVEGSGFGHPNYENLQWDATVKGSSIGKTMAPEILNDDSVEATVAALSKEGGLAKLIPLGDLWWKSISGDLRDIWKEVYGKNAESKWIDETKKGVPAISPPDAGPEHSNRLAAFGSLAAAYPNPVTGCMGALDDYAKLTMKNAISAFGLNPDSYKNGGFIAKIGAAELGDAVQNMVDSGGKMGKASVFSSLMFSEFNYIVADRATNTTESGDKDENPNAKKNSGEKHEKGKTEVAVVNFPASELFKNNPTYLPSS